MKKWILLLSVLFSCAYRPDQSTSTASGDTIFPHPSNIEDGEVHSKVAYANDISFCLACHKPENKSGKMRSCFLCHADGFAHTSGNFADPEVHAPVAITGGPMRVCLNCHGSTLQGGIGPSCYLSGCHAGSLYPHNVKDYALKSGHGSRTSQGDFPACLACHEKNTADAKGIAACADCHHNSDKNCLSCHPDPED